jgi:amino-acid N-acetyltransferase
LNISEIKVSEGNVHQLQTCSLSKVGVDVVSGNSFYTAQPVGIRNGVDFGRTGSVRSVDKANIQQHLDAGTIVLLSSLGYSPSGNVFNVRTEKLASVTAAELNAWKLIYVTPERLVQCNNDGDNCHVETAVLRSLRVVDAQALVKHQRSLLAARSLDLDKPSVYDLCDECVGALQKGVLRAHLLSPAPGALITELYTTDGVGTLISRDVYEGIRLATAADVPSISALIEPLVAEGTLVERPADVLTCDVEDGFYYVYMRDNVLLACAHLKRFSETHAEIGCFCVSPTYRRQGCGDAMLSFVERTAAAAGVEHLFALSTHTMLWFEERGFSETSLAALPEQRVAIYNHQRGSKIYIKALSSRLIDAQELVWLPSFPLTPPTFSN